MTSLAFALAQIVRIPDGKEDRAVWLQSLATVCDAIAANKSDEITAIEDAVQSELAAMHRLAAATEATAALWQEIEPKPLELRIIS